jgi:hypothetical protein
MQSAWAVRKAGGRTNSNKRMEQAEGGYMEKPIDFLKVIEDIEKTKEAELKQAFKQMRIVYLEMIEAEFTADEAMMYLAALTKQPSSTKE